MKLFVWADPHHVAYGSSMYFAIAENEAQARQLAQMALGYSHVDFEDAKAKGKTEELIGPPTRIIDLPCAEWHQWSE